MPNSITTNLNTPKIQLCQFSIQSHNEQPVLVTGKKAKLLAIKSVSRDFTMRIGTELKWTGIMAQRKERRPFKNQVKFCIKLIKISRRFMPCGLYQKRTSNVYFC